MMHESTKYDVHIGIDTHMKTNFCTTLERDDDTRRNISIPSSPEALYSYITRRYNGKSIICAYEAGGTGYHLHDYLVSHNIPCLITPPYSLPKAPNDRVKTNRLDSERIAQHLKNGDLPAIRVPDIPYRELRHIISTRERYISLIRQTKQRIKALLLFEHLHTEYTGITTTWSANYIRHLTELKSTPATRIRLDHLLEDLKYLRAKYLKVLRELRLYCRNDDQIHRMTGYLMSIPGIGLITASTIMARIGSPYNLSNPNEIAAFFGLVPQEYSTGDRVSRGRITHLGNAATRSLLIEAAWVAIRHDTQLAQFYHRIRSKHHPHIGSRKAIVAVARKMTLIIYRILKEERMYLSR